MTELQRLGGIVVSPRETFRDIDKRPTWFVPLLLTLAFSLAVNFVVFRVIVTDANFNSVALAKIEWDARERGQTADAGHLERQVQALQGQREHWYIVPIYGALLSALGISLFFYLVLLLAKAGTNFLKVFCVVCWSFPIYRGLGSIVTIAALLVRGPAQFDPAPAEAWSPTSLAVLIPRAAINPNLYSALSKLDLFLIWWLAVMTIGFAMTSRNLSLQRAAWIVVVSELVYLTLNAAGALPGAS